MHRIWTSTAETLLKIADGTKVEVACSAIDAYAAGCFVAEDDTLIILESMAKLKGLWIKGEFCMIQLQQCIQKLYAALRLIV